MPYENPPPVESILRKVRSSIHKKRKSHSSSRQGLVLLSGKPEHVKSPVSALPTQAFAIQRLAKLLVLHSQQLCSIRSYAIRDPTRHLIIITKMPPTEDIQYAPPGSYLAYKRNGRLLLRWIVRTVHAIIKSRDVTHQHDFDLRALKTTMAGLPGQNWPKELLSDPSRAGFFNRIRLYGFCNFISNHLDTIPAEIVALFLNLIDTRVTAFTTWQALTARCPRATDTDHYHTLRTDINSFWKALNTLRGFDNMSVPTADLGVLSKYSLPESEEDIDRLVPEMLSIHHRSLFSSTSKTRGSQSRFNKIRATLPPEDLPLSCFDIDDPGCVNGRFSANGNTWGMAAYDLFKEFVRLRTFLQNIWEEVVFGGINSAIAVRVGFAAMNLISTYDRDMIPKELHYIDMIEYFAGYHDPEDYVPPFSASVYQVHADGACSEVENQIVDMKEQLMIYTFESLVEFISDFRVNKNGVPTKRMDELLRKWNPSVDLMGLTKGEYLQWRHIYTIRLLYSLFYKYGPSILLDQRLTEDGKHIIGEGGSKYNPDNRGSDPHEAFLSSVINLALKGPYTDDSIRRSIEATTVFILQHMVDSFTVSRGWLHDPIRGPEFVQPPSVDTFFPARDLGRLFTSSRESDNDPPQDVQLGFSDSYLLLHRLEVKEVPDKRRPNGQLNELDYLLGFDKPTAEGREELSFLKHAAEVCISARECQSGEQQHQDVGAAFLWGFSPFQCGVVLLQALTDAAYVTQFLRFGFEHEPVLLVHLHNMLVLEGYLEEPALQFLILEKYFNNLVVKAAKTPEHGQAGAQYDRALRKALECLSIGVPPWAFGRLWDGKHGVGRIGRLENLQRFMENSNTIGETKRVPQVKGNGSRKNLEYTIKGGRGHAKTITKGLQAVGYDYKELVPGKLLEGPDGSKVMVNFLDVLELLKAEFSIDLHGSHSIDAACQLLVTHMSMKMFNFIELELAAVRDPLYLEIYGDPDLKRDEDSATKDEDPKKEENIRKEENPKGDDESSLNAGKQKDDNLCLSAKRARLIERLLTRNMNPPGTKTAIEVAVKAFENETKFPYGLQDEGGQTGFRKESDELINDKLEKGLAAASHSCPVM